MKLKIFYIICFVIMTLYIISITKEGFLTAPAYKVPKVDTNIKDQSVYNEVYSSMTTNCKDLGTAIGKVLSVSNKLTNIRNQINTGTVKLEFARKQLATIRGTGYLNCPAPSGCICSGGMCECNERARTGINTLVNTNYCNATNDIMLNFNYQMSPSRTFDPMKPVEGTNQPETVYDLNNYINQEFYYINKYYSIIKTLGVSLRCDLFL